MIIEPQTSLCNDLLAVQLDDGVIDLSWGIDTDKLKELLQQQGIQKILDFKNKVDFDIQIDNVDTFDSINLKFNSFSVEQNYRGNIIYSVVLPFNKNKFEETTYYFRIKIKDLNTSYIVKQNNIQDTIDISINDQWTEAFKFTIRKNYTKDIIETMYKMVPDINAYNKEAYSANMYYIFQAFADTLNKEFKYVEDVRNDKMINKILPDNLQEMFGVLFKFTNTYNLSMEEYRRILKNLIVGYQHGGAWDYIKNTLKYLLGHTPELQTLKEFYPWILRTKQMLGINETSDNPDQPIAYGQNDPTDYKDRTYFNPDSNYYIFKNDYVFSQDKNLVMLLNKNEKLFTFIVKSDNFFNVDIDTEKIKEILNLLKSTYTKYSLNIDDSIII